MGIKERREREKVFTKQAIVAAALNIARQEGWPGVTIRKIGEQIEYSPPMVYEYFSSKEEVFLELLRDSFRQLTKSIQHAVASTHDREERLWKIVEAYWQFAMHNRERYQLMHGLGGVSLDMSAVAQAIDELCQSVAQALVDWAQDNALRLDDPLGTTEVLWSLLHGMVSLALVERVAGGQERAKRLMIQTINDLLTAWKLTRR